MFTDGAPLQMQQVPRSWQGSGAVGADSSERLSLSAQHDCVQRAKKPQHVWNRPPQRYGQTSKLAANQRVVEVLLITHFNESENRNKRSRHLRFSQCNRVFRAAQNKSVNRLRITSFRPTLTG